MMDKAVALSPAATAALRTIAGTILPDHVPDPLPEGVYIGLDEDIYHDDPALGSSDMKRLAKSPPDFWWNSKFNPQWEPEKESSAMRLGKAAHKCILEGHALFRKLYVPTKFPGNVKAGKEEREAAEAKGLIWLPADDYARVEMMGGMVRSNPTLARAFEGGVASEVSIFWRCKNGMRKKARIDYLKARANVDLKTISNKFDDEFPLACRKAIGNLRYDVQAAHYAEGRAQLARLVEAGAVFSDTPDRVDKERLLQAAMTRGFAFVFVFVQSSGAPLTWGATLSAKLAEDGSFETKNAILDIGARTVQQAEDNWAAFCAKFNGLALPWVLDAPLEELSIDDFSAWAFR